MNIYKLEVVTQKVIDGFERLIPQLSADSNSIKGLDLETIINSTSTKLFVAEENNEIIGTLSLVLYKIPTGEKVWIEDVVVDKSFRGRGIGKDLILFAIKYAKEKNIKSINLTSRPEREIANNLYQNLGFIKRKTNVYKIKL